MEDSNMLLVDVTVPPEMDSPLEFSHPLISKNSPQISTKLDVISNKENADATIDSIEIERSDDSNRRHSITLSTPGVLHRPILRDVTQKSACNNGVFSPVVTMLEDEIFDFDFDLSPPSSDQSKEADKDEEVFFGPVGFAERCVAQAVGPEVKPLSPLNAGQLAEIAKEAALVAYRIKSDYKTTSTSNEGGSPPKKRHSRCGTFTMDDSPLKLLSLPIIESEEPVPDVETISKPESVVKQKGNTVTKGNKENLLEQGRKLLTPTRSKSRRSGLVSPASKAKKSLQEMFKTKPTEKRPDEDVPTESEVEITKPDVKVCLSNPVPIIKPALTNKIPEKKSGLARPLQRLQPPKSHLAVKAMDASITTQVTGSKPSLKRSLQPPKVLNKERDISTNKKPVNKEPDFSTNKKQVNNPNRKSIQPPKSLLAVKTDSSTMKNTTTHNRRSLNTTVSVTGTRSTPSVASSSGKESKLKVSAGNSGTKLNRSYTISEPKSSEVLKVKQPASKPSLLQPSQMKRRTIAVPNSTKVPNGPVKAIAPAEIQSRTVERKPSVKLRSSSSSGQNVAVSTPTKQQKDVHPKVLSSTFTTTPTTSESTKFMSSTPSSTSTRRSCLPTPNTSRTSSISSIPPPSPLSFRSGSSTSSCSNVSESPFTSRGRGQRLSRKRSVGMYSSLDEINEHSPSALMAACKISTTNA